MKTSSAAHSATARGGFQQLHGEIGQLLFLCDGELGNQQFAYEKPTYRGGGTVANVLIQKQRIQQHEQRADIFRWQFFL